MKLSFLGGLVLGTVITLAAIMFYTLATFTLDFSQTDDSDHLRARLEFIEGAAGRDCLTEDALHAEAAVRGWPIKDVAAEALSLNGREGGAVRAIEIDIDPPVAFSKGWGTRYDIDADGCLIF